MVVIATTTPASPCWTLISQYDNTASKADGRVYKKKFADLPTVDHVGDGTGPADFVICSWRVNDCKNDLTYEEFVAVCRQVLEHADALPTSNGIGTSRAAEMEPVQ